MRCEELYSHAGHRWMVLGRDPQRRDQIIDTNQYVIVSPEGVLLLDPGGIEIFPRMLAELSQHIDLGQIHAIFASHQDPDIVSSMAMWLDLLPEVSFYTPWLWTQFIAHFSMGTPATVHGLPDEGADLHVGKGGPVVHAIPAHYCHASGNLSIWDPKARILFSGDVGAGLVPQSAPMFVEDFKAHIEAMEGFHRRWMPSNRALRQWCGRVRELRPEMVCPQHGSIFRGEHIDHLLTWLEQLDVESLDPNATTRETP